MSIRLTLTTSIPMIYELEYRSHYRYQ